MASYPDVPLRSDRPAVRLRLVDLSALPAGPREPTPEQPVEPLQTGRGARLAAAARAFFAQPGFILAALLTGFTIFAALWPQLVTGFDPFATSPGEQLVSPGWAHWFGTDDLGRDLFSRVVYGAHTSVRAALFAVGLALLVGPTLGVLSGFCGGRADAAIMRLIDMLLALPTLLLCMAIVTAIGFGTIPVAVAVGASMMPGLARTTRAEVLRVKTLPYVEAARLGGARWPWILWHHILPNSWGPVAVLATVDLGTAILSTAALSYLGFGAAPPSAEWGTLISDGRDFLLTAPWVSLIPGCYVVAAVFSLNHIARALEEAQR